MHRLALAALLLPLLALGACGDGTDDAVSSPTADELTSAQAVADQMRQRYESNQGSVEAFTVRGGGGVARHVRNPADTTGLIPFTLTLEPEGGNTKLDPETFQLHYNLVPNALGLANGLGGADLAGVVQRDGRRAYVLSTDDPAALLGGTPPPGDHELRVYVDTETFDIVEIYRSVADDSTKAPITDRLLYSDFQTTDGLTLPHTVRHIVTGVNRDLTEEVKVAELGNIGLERARAEQMPEGPERRIALEQAERQQRMIAEGVAEATLTISTVRVDRGGAAETSDATPDAAP